jgi:hypothetical protein
VQEWGAKKHLLLEDTTGVEHTFMLRLRGDDVLLLLFVEVRDALYRKIVGLCRS